MNMHGFVFIYMNVFLCILNSYKSLLKDMVSPNRLVWYLWVTSTRGSTKCVVNALKGTYTMLIIQKVEAMNINWAEVMAWGML